MLLQSGWRQQQHNSRAKVGTAAFVAWYPRNNSKLVSIHAVGGPAASVSGASLNQACDECRMGRESACCAFLEPTYHSNSSRLAKSQETSCGTTQHGCCCDGNTAKG